MIRRGQLAVVVCGLSTLVSCVSPAPDATGYEGKASLSAQDATSSVRTALLAVRTYAADDLTASYLEVVLVESETSVGAVQTTFDSVQPPDESRADRLRDDLDALLSDAAAGLADLRIAARRDEPAELGRIARELVGTADALEAFGAEHAS